MPTESYTRALRLIEERIVALQRDLQGMVSGGPTVAESGYGCCSKEGCCEKQGCCERTHLPDFREYVLPELAARFGLPVQEFLDRVSKLDPKLLQQSASS